MIDNYQTIKNPISEILFKDKNSKFFGFAFPVDSEDDVKLALEELKQLHPSANHHCYAYKIGVENFTYRANDDGEPNNSAGMPIYGQILSFDVTNILIVVVRCFGGTKLGVSGLINAYKTTAQMVLEQSEIIEKVIKIKFKLNFGYDKMSNVMRIIKEKNLEITSQKMELECEFVISVRKKEASKIFKLFDRLYQVDIQKLEV